MKIPVLKIEIAAIILFVIVGLSLWGCAYYRYCDDIHWANERAIHEAEGDAEIAKAMGTPPHREPTAPVTMDSSGIYGMFFCFIIAGIIGVNSNLRRLRTK